jgi:hypothetical protein
MNPSANSVNFPSTHIVENNSTSVQTKKILVQGTETFSQKEQGVKLIQNQIKNLIILKRAAMAGDDQAAAAAAVLKAQIEDIVYTLTSTPVVVEEPERTETPDIEEEEEEEVSTYVPWKRPAHHRCLSLYGMQKFDEATGFHYGGKLEQRYCEWIDAGRPDVNVWFKREDRENEVQSTVVEQLEVPQEDEVQSVCSEQVEVDFIEDEVQSVCSEQVEVDFIEDDEDDETSEDAMKRECFEMIQKIAYITPLHSLELEVTRCKNLIAEYEWMQEQKLNAPILELLEEINEYMGGQRDGLSTLQEERQAASMAILAYECIQLSRDDDGESDDESESEDDCPTFTPFNRTPKQKLINAWYGPNGKRTEEETNEELAAALARQREHEEILGF